MKSVLMVSVLLFFWMSGWAQKGDDEAIRKMLASQVSAWNMGNLEGYMKGYWEHDSLVFIGKNGPTYGYVSTLERYKKSYPDPDAMGKLTSTLVSIQRLCRDNYFVVGKWHLERKAGDLNGSFTLLLRRIKGSWVIINDHSS